MSAVRGEGVCPERTFYGQGGSSAVDNRTSTFFMQKTSIFLKYMVCLHGQGGGWVEPVWTLGEGVNFWWFCADILYGQLLSIK